MRIVLLILALFILQDHQSFSDIGYKRLAIGPEGMVLGICTAASYVCTPPILQSSLSFQYAKRRASIFVIGFF